MATTEVMRRYIMGSVHPSGHLLRHRMELARERMKWLEFCANEGDAEASSAIKDASRKSSLA